MNCGFSGCTPPRRAAIARSFVLLFSMAVIALGPAAVPASGYPCGSSDATRTLAGHIADRDCEPTPPRRLKHRTADPMSFVFFIGIMLAVVLVPVALGRQDELTRE